MTFPVEKPDVNEVLLLGPVHPELANAPRPIKLEPYQRELELGEVFHFKPEKGYGHFDTQLGHLFFHVSGYRIPSVREHREAGVTRHLLQLERLPRTISGQEVPTLSFPELNAGTPVLFLRGRRTTPAGTEGLAQLWTLQEAYDNFLMTEQARREEELETWIKLGRYRLTFFARIPGLPFVTGEPGEQKVERPEKVFQSVLFEGTETNMLHDWYQHYQRELDLGPDRWIVLSYQEYEEAKGRHGPWIEVDQETMHDMLG